MDRFPNPCLDNERTSPRIAATLSLLRNVSAFVFPTCLDQEQKTQMFELLTHPLSQHPCFAQGGQILKGEEMSVHDQEYLSEHFLQPTSYALMQQGEGWIRDAQGVCLGVCNHQEHLCIIRRCQQERLEQALHALWDIEAFLAKHIEFAFHPKFGYLTSNLRHVGMGLEAKIFLHLPSLVLTEQMASYRPKSPQIQMRPFASQQHWPGHLVVLTHQSSLGVSEQELLERLEQECGDLIDREMQMRPEVWKNPEIKNQVWRSFGMVKYAQALEVQEAMEMISYLKMGVDAGWIQGVDTSLFDSLLLSQRRGHLSHLLISDAKRVQEVRAEDLRHCLQSMSVIGENDLN